MYVKIYMDVLMFRNQAAANMEVGSLLPIIL